jgi:hypothetical protein
VQEAVLRHSNLPSLPWERPHWVLPNGHVVWGGVGATFGEAKTINLIINATSVDVGSIGLLGSLQSPKHRFPPSGQLILEDAIGDLADAADLVLVTAFHGRGFVAWDLATE